MHVKGCAVIQNFEYCNKYHKCKVGSNVTHGNRVHCDENEVNGENRVPCATLADATTRIVASS